MQGQSTGKRLALLVIIIAGLLGALLLLGWIAFWLIAFAALALFFLLIAPFVFLMPALGEAGRQGFITWGKRLLGALIAKLLYAIVLGVVIYVAARDRRDGQPRRARLARRLGRRSDLLVGRVPEAPRAREPAHLQRRSRRRAAAATRRDGLAGLYYKTRLAQEADAHRPPSGRAPGPAAGRAREHDRGGRRTVRGSGAPRPPRRARRWTSSTSSHSGSSASDASSRTS